MKLKQTTLDFEFTPGENKPVEKPVLQKPGNIMVEEEPIEVNLQPVTQTAPAAPAKKSTRGRMKLSDMSSGAELIDIPDDEVLFSKSYYSISAVSEMFKVNQSLIRFWENEFIILKPKKNAKGDRLFRPEDVKNLKLIYHLLRERKYTIDGAKEFLKKNKHADKKFEMIESLKDLKSFLTELKANI